MKYAIRYIQYTPWLGGLKTERGWEAWVDEHGYCTTAPHIKVYPDINEAHRKLGSGQLIDVQQRYRVEEYTQ